MGRLPRSQQIVSLMLFLLIFALFAAAEDENSMVVIQDMDVNPVSDHTFQDCSVSWPWHLIQAFAAHLSSMMTTSSASCPSGIFSMVPPLALACRPVLRVANRDGKSIFMDCHRCGGALVTLSNWSDMLFLVLLIVREVPLTVSTRASVTMRGLGARQHSRAKRSLRGLQDWEQLDCHFELVTYALEQLDEGCHTACLTNHIWTDDCAAIQPGTSLSM